MKTTRAHREALSLKIKDKKLTKAERREAYHTVRDGLLNPRAKKDFDPKTFDPYDDEEDYDIKKRPRIEPPRILPDMGMLPKEIMEGQMIGMYESKQDLYLLIAWLSRRLTEAEDTIEALKNNPQN
jgi:hypothetical protein